MQVSATSLLASVEGFANHGSTRTWVLQSFTAWTNLSEAVFLCKPTDERAHYRLRIFDPTRELPFAGHPTLGKALGEARLRPGPRYNCLKTCASHSTRHSRRMPRMARTWGPRRFFSWRGDGGFL